MAAHRPASCSSCCASTPRSPTPTRPSSTRRTISPAAFPASTKCCAGRDCSRVPGASISPRRCHRDSSRRSTAWSASTAPCWATARLRSTRVAAERSIHLLGALLEAAAELAEVRDGGVEHHRVRRDGAGGAQLVELRLRGTAHLAVTVAIEEAPAADEVHAELRLNGLQHAEQAVNRTARRARGGLVHRHDEEAVVDQLAGHGERLAVRLPVREVFAHLAH